MLSNFFLEPALFAVILGAVIGGIKFLAAKHNERQAINRSLLSEILRLQRVIESHRTWWDNCVKHHHTDLPLISFSTEFYDVLLQDWGKVDRSYAGNAVRFYGYLKFVNRLQESRAEHEKIIRATNAGWGSETFATTYQNSLKYLEEDFRNKFNKAFRKFKVKAS